MLVNLRSILQDAMKNNYAVGAFGTVNMEITRGIIEAAEELNSPVIIMLAEVFTPFAPVKDVAAHLVPMAKKAKVPVCVHFDHGLTENKIQEAIDTGFSSVMYDCSQASFEENISRCRSMAMRTHFRGVSLEAELGHVGANEGGGEADSAHDSIYTEPAEAKKFVDMTRVDALAVAIGTAHGEYKSTPILDLERLKDIKKVVSCPLVLHGGSGLSDEDFRGCIRNGISKINIFTDLNYGATSDFADGQLHARSGLTDLIPMMVENVKRETMKKIELFGSAGHAQ